MRSFDASARKAEAGVESAAADPENPSLGPDPALARMKCD